MKIQYNLETAWPTDVANPDGFEALDWFQFGEIPFLPVAGMLIDCSDGDLRVVHQVFWYASKPDLVEVWFEDDEVARPLDYWMRGGWQTKDLPMPMPARKAARSRKAQTGAVS